MKTRILALLVAALTAPSAQAADHKGHGPTLPPGCAAEDTRLACASQATPVFLPDGALVLGWVAGGRVMAARSNDGGASFEQALSLNAGRETIDANADARLALAADSRGRVFAAWATRDKSYNGTLALARSTDGGRSFQPSPPLAAAAPSRRFPTLKVEPGDRLLLAWIEKSADPSRKTARLGLARSDDGAETLTTQETAQSDVCECCRIGLELTPDGRPVLLWRHVFAPNIRDHAVMVFADRDRPGPIRKIAEDNWRVDACPHVGPSLAATPDGALHVAWYTAGTARKGMFFASAAGPEAPFSEPQPLGDAAMTVSQPSLLTVRGRLWMAWKEFDGETTTVLARHSDDSGRSWSAPRPVARTADASDRPILAGNGKGALLSWVTRAEGWRLTAVE
ncbi:sialidase family protein [Paramagnetospirillum magneticum]|uniref:Glycosyl hydrolase n=1 Tax=Paramagnetospirillum magneticum (strain ATCC 700264 / AMB-1) TaxID=342108 RepID=Q2W1C3_PARM1|nr:sialidase family protein [Paramagnetospirillum magneticum]BAE52352.1 hypothetical protein amb3548 [Paramagnetospirillum magneticum AMB-1]